VPASPFVAAASPLDSLDGTAGGGTAGGLVASPPQPVIATPLATMAWKSVARTGGIGGGMRRWFATTRDPSSPRRA
jgi:hypothetical protein